MRVALNIHPTQTFHESIQLWVRTTYTGYQGDIDIFEDEVKEEQINPYALVIVYFIDYEWNAIQITRVCMPPPVPQPPQALPNWPILGNGINCNMDQLTKRLEWLETDSTKPCFEEDPMLEYSTRRIVGFVIDDYTKEKEVFLAHCPRQPNGVPIPQIPPTLQDLQNYRRRYPNGFPREWYELEMSELPSTLSNELPLYENRKVHITCEDLPEYLWIVFCKLQTKLKNAMWEHGGHPQLDYLMDIYMTNKNKRRKVPAKDQNVLDIEDLEKKLPCCIRNFDHFPRDMERQFFVRILKGANVPLERVIELLDGLNERYPHASGAVALKKRWDPTHHFNRGYGAPTCEAMGELCPFIGPIDRRKMQCHSRFRAKYPELYKDSQARGFYGPKNYLQWFKK